MGATALSLAMFCLALGATARVQAADDDPAASGKREYVNSCATCHLSLIHISEPTRPY